MSHFVLAWSFGSMSRTQLSDKPFAADDHVKTEERRRRRIRMFLVQLHQIEDSALTGLPEAFDTPLDVILSSAAEDLRVAPGALQPWATSQIGLPRLALPATGL
jgi:hypothetical protein